MSADFLVDLSPGARKVIKTLGLPIPMPQKLDRATGPWTERPLHDASILVCTGPKGQLTGPIAQTVARAGANPLVVGDADTPVAVLLDHGLLVPTDGEPELLCSEGYGGAALAFGTQSGGLLVAGDDGPWLTTNGGCAWSRTAGIVSTRRVPGAYQSAPGHPRIVFALHSPLDGSSVAASEDGGFTSEALGLLTDAEVEVTGLVGEGDAIAVVGVDPNGVDASGWLSDDGGATFAPVQLGLSGVVTPAALIDGVLWVWAGAALERLSFDGSGPQVERTFAEAGPWSTAADDDGRLWVAAGAEGLWMRSADGAWSQIDTSPTVVVRAWAGRVWAARDVTGAGDPLVVLTDDGGASWRSVLGAPETWSYPAGCESYHLQACGPYSAALRVDLGLPPAPDDTPDGLPDLGDDEEPEVDGDGGGCGAARSGGSGHGPAALCLLLLALASAHRERPGTP